MPKFDIKKIIKRHKKYSSKLPVMQGEVETIIEEIQKETGLDKSDIREIITSQFRFIENVASFCKPINSKEFNPEEYKSVRLSKLGRFEVINSFRREYKE